MNHLPFDKPGRFFRGNLHTHTTKSDGRLSAADVCAYYRDAGYSFVALTDHFMERFRYPITDDAGLHAADFITLTGAELHAGTTIASGIWHILSVGIPADFAPNLPDETGPQIAARALETGAYVACAHPAWYNLTEADVRSLGPVDAIEIYNGISADHNDRADSCYMLDVMLAQGFRYFACATDDSHFHEKHADVLRGWVQVRAETLTREAILAALKAGHYYSSTGPEIYDVEFKGKTRVVVRCSPAADVFVTGIGPLSRVARGAGLRAVEIALDNFDSPYCRVTVRDARGGHAWTNPIWFDQRA